jgi:hypothetical protein
VRCGYFEHEGLRELPPAAKPDEPWRPPRYLRDAKGRPRAVPARGLQVLCCGWCKTPLVRADYFWVCPNGFHGKAQTDAGLLAALLAVWKLPLGQKQLDAPRRVLRNVYQLPALQRQQEG